MARGAAAKAAAKQAKATAGGSAARATGSTSAPQPTGSAPSPSQGLFTLLKPLVLPVSYVVGAYMLFAFILPGLAEMTPPGVDPKAVAAAVQVKISLAQRGCENACKGMSCPAGWTTGRDKQDVCKCICVRLDPSQTTAWDLERAQKEMERERQAQQQAANRLAAEQAAGERQSQQQPSQQPPQQQPPREQPPQQLPPQEQPPQEQPSQEQLDESGQQSLAQ